MKEVIREYTTANGNTVTVTRYKEAGGEDWQVKHSNKEISAYWCKDRRSAMIHAQFLAGKY